MPGLVPGIHVLRTDWQVVDGRDKPGHDAGAPSFHLLYRLAASLMRRLILAALALSSADGCWPVAAHRQAQ
ncbi:hypothetical protein ABIA03_006283 [Bradyrhizobium yuanmingense]|uniref:Uncharacterized protein n=1 Tax=Bradyrhizobium yuanmingense TaxID=108015 RepID=A0ABV4GXP6_9BRAD